MKPKQFDKQLNDDYFLALQIHEMESSQGVNLYYDCTLSATKNDAKLARQLLESSQESENLALALQFAENEFGFDPIAPSAKKVKREQHSCSGFDRNPQISSDTHDRSSKTPIENRKHCAEDKAVCRHQETQCQEAQCGICLEPLGKKKPVEVLGCGHVFHQAEVHRWFQTSKTRKCPICRK